MENAIKGAADTAAPLFPFVREAVQRCMMKVARDIGGPIDMDPGRHLPGTEGTLLLPKANLLIGGTSAFRPLHWDRFSEAGDRYSLDMLLVRFDAYQQSFDIRLQGEPEWLANYQPSFDCGLWFLPVDEGEQPSVKASRHGLVLLPYAVSYEDQAVGHLVGRLAA